MLGRWALGLLRGGSRWPVGERSWARPWRRRSPWRDQARARVSLAGLAASVSTPDGKSVVFVVRDKGVDNLWAQPLDGSASKPLTHFTADRILRFVFSPDGSHLAIERGEQESDVVLLKDSGSK